MYNPYGRRQWTPRWGHCPQAKENTQKRGHPPAYGHACELFPANRLCLNYQSMPINQLNHIYTADISQPKSSSAFTRECSWSRGKAQQTPNTTHVIEVEPAACRGGCSGSPQPGWGLVLLWDIPQRCGLSTWGVSVAQREQWSSLWTVFPWTLLRMQNGSKMKMCSFTFEK